MTQMEFRKDDLERLLARPEGYLDRVRNTSHHSYIANVKAANTAAVWLMVASTATNSAGFLFAMRAPPSMPSLAAALCFLVALTSTLICGVFVTQAYASKPATDDSLRQIEDITAKDYFSNADERPNAGRKAYASLSVWTKISIITMFLGGLCLIAGRAAQLSETTPLLNFVAI